MVYFKLARSNQGRPSYGTSSPRSSNSKIRSRVSSLSIPKAGADEAESETRVDELKAEITTLAQKLAEQDAQGHELARVNAKIRKNEDRYLVKRQTLSSRKDEYTNAIRDLGILPEEAYTKYVDASLDKVCPFSLFKQDIADKPGGQEASQSEGISQEIRPCQQEGF